MADNGRQAGRPHRTDRQTDKDRQAGRQTDRKTYKESKSEREQESNSDSDRCRERCKLFQTDRVSDGELGRDREIATGRQRPRWRAAREREEEIRRDRQSDTRN